MRDYYVNVDLINSEMKTYKYKYPPLSGEEKIIAPFSTSNIRDTQTYESNPGPIKIRITDTETNEMQVYDVQVTDTPVVQPIYISGGSETNRYYFNYAFENPFDETVTIQLPAVGIEPSQIVVPPRSQIFFNTSLTGQTKPPPFVAQVSINESRSLLMKFQDIPPITSIDIDLGTLFNRTNGEEKIYYLNYLLYNSEYKDIKMSVPEIGYKPTEIINIPHGTSGTVFKVEHKATIQPPSVQVEFQRDGGEPFYYSFEFRNKSDVQYLDVGKLVEDGSKTTGK